MLRPNESWTCITLLHFVRKLYRIKVQKTRHEKENVECMKPQFQSNLYILRLVCCNTNTTRVHLYTFILVQCV